MSLDPSDASRTINLFYTVDIAVHQYTQTGSAQKVLQTDIDNFEESKIILLIKKIIKN